VQDFALIDRFQLGFLGSNLVHYPHPKRVVYLFTVPNSQVPPSAFRLHPFAVVIFFFKKLIFYSIVHIELDFR